MSRRLLVDKCQEEFMAGMAATEALEAVKKREAADAEKGKKATPVRACHCSPLPVELPTSFGYFGYCLLRL